MQPSAALVATTWSSLPEPAPPPSADAREAQAGDDPPPIKLETDTNRLLDGKHRAESKKKYATWYKSKATEEERSVFPEPTDELECEYEEIPEDIPAKLWCAQYNRDHGERTSDKDARLIARELYQGNPKVSEGMIGTCLGRAQQRVSDWIKDLKAQQNQKREWDLEILRRLGWTQKEIGGALGLKQSSVSEALSGIPDSVKPIKTQLAKTGQIEEVADAYNMPLTLATALDLDSIREDGDRAKQLGANIRPHDAWMFSGFRDLFGHDYPGRPIHRFARGPIPVPLHGPIIGFSPPLQIRQLAPQILSGAGHAQIYRVVLFGHVLLLLSVDCVNGHL